MPWSGKRVLVVGLGRSGQAAVRLLHSAGARVLGNDARRELPSSLEDVAGKPGIDVWLGSHPVELLGDVDLVVTSPGVSLQMQLLQEAIKRNIPVWSELELGTRFWRGQILGVTGSNGKTTTTAWLGDILQRAGIPARVAGNIGKPVSEVALEAGRSEVLALEVSSFQLETVTAFRPRVGAVLNLSPDHLDRHGSLAAYAEAKSRIFQQQSSADWAVLNADYPEVALMHRRVRSRPFWLSRRAVRAPGTYVRDEAVILDPAGDNSRKLCEVRDIGLPGWHNLENALAAAGMAYLAGANDAGIREGLRYFPGVEHRMEWVAEVQGVTFVNDSKATNAEASRVAMEALSPPVVLLAGGRDKGGPLQLWAETVEKRARAAVLFGEAAPRLRQALEGRGFRAIWDEPGLKAALDRAWASACPGDVILLSPACSSFDQFRDFEERGRLFKDAVARLKGGEPGANPG